MAGRRSERQLRRETKKSAIDRSSSRARVLGSPAASRSFAPRMSRSAYACAYSIEPAARAIDTASSSSAGSVVCIDSSSSRRDASGELRRAWMATRVRLPSVMSRKMLA